MQYDRDLMQQLSEKVALADGALKQFRIRGRAYADAERIYREALAKKILFERENGTPVTIISDICRGDRDIAKLKCNRDIAQTIYEAAKEALNLYKLQIRVLENTIEREYRG